MTKRTAILLATTLTIIITIALTITAWVITVGWLKLVVLIVLVQ